MDVQVVYDNEGQVIAVAVPLPPAYDFMTPRSGAVASDGQQVAVLALPAEAAELSLSEISDRLRVNQEGAPRLEARS
jgi:hypothetical protein